MQAADHRHHLRLQRPPYPAGHRRGGRLRAEGSRVRAEHGKHHEGSHGAGVHEAAQEHGGGPEQDQIPASGAAGPGDHGQPGGGNERPVPHGFLPAPADRRGPRGPGHHLRFRHPRQRKDHRAGHQRAVPEGCGRHL